MSIYNVISTEIPVIAYSVLHYPGKTVTHKEYVRSMLQLHQAVSDESSKIQHEWSTHLADIKAKTVQTMRGALSQYLSTPIQSDTFDIEQIIGDQVIQLSEQLLPKISYGIVSSSEHLLQLDESAAGFTKWMNAAKKQLRSIGFPSKDVYESFFVIEGGSNLDILEYIIRTRIGVQSGAHGKHLQFFGGASFTVYNLIYSKNELVRTHEKTELTISFKKGNEPYDTFKSTIIAILSSMITDAKLSHISLWQRKLGIGDEIEFRLTLRGKEKSLLFETAEYFLSTVKKNKIAASHEYIFLKDILG